MPKQNPNKPSAITAVPEELKNDEKIVKAAVRNDGKRKDEKLPKTAILKNKEPLPLHILETDTAETLSGIATSYPFEVVKVLEGGRYVIVKAADNCGEKLADINGNIIGKPNSTFELPNGDIAYFDGVGNLDEIVTSIEDEK